VTKKTQPGCGLPHAAPPGTHTATPFLCYRVDEANNNNYHAKSLFSIKR
jgi:hypothetical protein